MSQEGAQGWIYHPRRPKESPPWKCLGDHLDGFLNAYPANHETQHGFLRSVIPEVIGKFLDCGDPGKDFARVYCDDCRNEYLLAFSCKGRWFCPSCHQKKVIQFGELLADSVLYPLPHRQYVFSIPNMLRVYFRNNRKLLGTLCKAAHESLTRYLKEVTGLSDGVPGIVMAIQTFGDHLNFHPHLHALVADGLFRGNGAFHVMPKNAPLKPLERLFQAAVLRMLVSEGLLGEEMASRLLSWRNTGFNVHNGVRIARDDAKGLEGLAQYIIRNPFSVEKMIYDERTGTVIYRSKMSHRTKRNFEVFKATDFIAEITQHIPDKGAQMVRYYGWYSNKSRGVRLKRETAKTGEGEPANGVVEVIDASDYEPKPIPSKKWCALIRKVWEVDPILCPRCGARCESWP